MAKDFIVVGLENEAVRAVRFAAKGTEYVCAESAEWSLAPSAAPEGVENGAADDGGDADESSAGAPAAAGGFSERLAAVLDEIVARFKTREIELVLPLSMALAKGFGFPLADREELEEDASAAIEKMSPFPDEALAVGAEVVGETDREVYLVAAALPEASSAEVGEALEMAKVRVTRTDLAVLGLLRGMWPEVVKDSSSMRMVLFEHSGGWEIVVMEGGAPRFLRGLGAVDAAELSREATLSLIECDLPRPLDEVVVVSADPPAEEFAAALAAFAPVRHVVLADPFVGVEGCAWRSTEGSSLDVTPEAWREALRASRFRRKLVAFLTASIGLWVLAIGVLVGVPFAYDRMTEHQKDLCKRHAKQYREVKALKARVQLVRKYSDHTRGALEILKAVSDNMPEGIVLSSFQFKRDEKDESGAAATIRISGDSDDPNQVYKFKNALVDAPPADDADAKLFQSVKLKGLSQSRGRHRFDMDVSFGMEEGE